MSASFLRQASAGCLETEHASLHGPFKGAHAAQGHWDQQCLYTDAASVQGRNVVLESKYGSPKIVNDGVTVAKEVELEDPVENIGAKLVRQVRVCKNMQHESGTRPSLQSELCLLPSHWARQELEGPVENIGAKLVRQVRTNKDCRIVAVRNA